MQPFCLYFHFQIRTVFSIIDTQNSIEIVKYYEYIYTHSHANTRTHVHTNWNCHPSNDIVRVNKQKDSVCVCGFLFHFILRSNVNQVEAWNHLNRHRGRRRRRYSIDNLLFDKSASPSCFLSLARIPFLYCTVCVRFLCLCCCEILCGDSDALNIMYAIF